MKPDFFTRLALPLLTLALAPLVAPPAAATNYYFDVNGAVPGSGVTNHGSYDGTQAYWSTDVNGAAATAVLTIRNYLVFSAGTDASNLNYTVTGNLNQLGGNTVPGGITVAAGNVTLSGGGTFYGGGGQTVKTLAGTSLSLTNTLWDFYGHVPTFDAAAGTTITLNSLSTTSGRAGGAYKISPGLLYITGAASARGIMVTATNGELRLANGNALFTGGYAASVTISNAASLELAKNITVSNNPVTLNGPGYNNNGALLNYADTNVYASLITLAGNSRINANAGSWLTLRPASGSALTGSYGLTLGGAGTIVVGAAVDAITALTLDGTVSVVLTNGGLTSSPNINVGAGAGLDASALGTLSLAGSQALGGGGTVNGSVATSTGSQIYPGGNLTAGTLTITTNLTLAGGETFNFDFPASTTNDVVVVEGNLTPGATPSIINLATLPVAGLAPGNYVLFQIGGTLGGAATNFVVTAASAQSFSVLYDQGSSPKRVLLQVSGNSGPQNLVWQGGQGGNAWDLTGATTNWLNNGQPAVFYTGDNVSFTDAGAANQPVLAALVSPGSVKVTVNSPNAYAFTGTGGITGVAGLTMSGSGTLGVATANNYTGNTLVSGGTLELEDGGSVAGTITNNALVNFNVNAADVVFTNPIAGSGSVTDAGTASVTLAGPVTLGGTLADNADGNLSISGSLTVNAPVTNLGSGTLTLGNVTINNGGGLVNNGGGTIVLAGTTTSTGGAANLTGTLQIGNGTIGVPGTGPLVNQGTLVLNSGQNFTINDVISGGGNVVKNAANTVTLAGANTSSGTLTINAGALVAANGAALGSSPVPVVVTGTGTLEFQGGITVTNAVKLSGRATATPATLANLSGTNWLAGDVTGDSGGGAYNVQAAGGKLVIAGNYYNIYGNGATRNLYLQGAGQGQWTGIISNGAPGVNNTIAVVKQDAGRWTLSNTNAYTGATTISGGTLALDASGNLAASPAVNIGAGAVLDVSAQNFVLRAAQTLAGGGAVNGTVTTSAGSQILPGGAGSAGTLTFSNALNLSGGETLAFDLPGTGTNDLVVVQGDLNTGTGAPTVLALATLPATGYLAPGDYVLVQVGGHLHGSPADFAISAPAARQTYAVTVNTTSSPNQILLHVTGTPAALVWVGGQNGNAWDLAATPNWLNGANPDVFYNGDNVLLAAASTANPPVITGSLFPTALTVSNAWPDDCALSGSGSLAGPGVLSKAGSGQLSIGTANTYTGGTVLGGGTVSLGTATALGSAGAIDFVANTTLQWNGPTNDLSARLKIEDGVTATLDTMGANVTLGSTLSLGALKTGALTKQGAGLLVLNASQLFTGPLTVAAGAIKMANFKTLASNLVLDLAAGAALYPDGSSLAFDQVTGEGTLALTYTNAGTDTLTLGGANGTSEFDGAIADSPGARRLAVTKTGSGVFTLGGSSTYTGPTLVSNGTLLVTGTLGNTAVTVAGGTLAGNGTLGGAVTNRAGSWLAPGTDTPGTLTLNGNLTLAGNLRFKLDKGAPQTSDEVAVGGLLVNTGTGTLALTNLGPALAAGDRFVLFSQPLVNGSALSVVPPPGVVVTNQLALDGSVVVLSATANYPTNLAVSLAGQTLTLAWPATHFGWLVQSNALGLDIPNGWFDLPGSGAVTNLVLTVDPTKTSVFYRLRHP